MCIRDRTPGVITALDISNTILAASQTMFHLGSVAYTLNLLDSGADDLLAANDAEKARLSPYGLVALLAHLDSYGSLETIGRFKGLGSPIAFTRTYWPDKKINKIAKPDKDEDGFKIFAAVTNISGDEFTKNRGWSYEFPAPLSIHDGNYKPVNMFPLSIPRIPIIPPDLYIQPRVDIDVFSLLNIVLSLIHI